MSPQRNRRSRLVLSSGCVVTSLALLGYASLYLRTSLPSTYLASNWSVAWIGLDLAMAALSILTLYLSWRRSTLIVVSSSMLAVLFILDAWFDCITANRADRKLSLASLIVEIPAAAFFLWIALTESRRVPVSGRHRDGGTKREPLSLPDEAPPPDAAPNP